ncbi:MAG: hypothetical protein J0L51_13285 [Rhizobiales bacterium]|nr:hypothetical protein [Hyphomicrobiales bacterium]
MPGHVTSAETQLVVTPVGPNIVLFDPVKQGCDGNDIPDMPLRVYRDAEGKVAAFALHYENRRLSGASLEKLALDCKIVFRATRNSDPKQYDDRAWLAATYTEDGTRVFGLVHHEFQADAHKGRCAFAEYIQCWWNSILAVSSRDGGRSFMRQSPQVAMASPEPSEAGQGRHRGFFNPSNIVKQNGAYFTLIATTGWQGQPSGVCLFRNNDPANSAGWRAYDGKDYTARFPDPYGTEKPKMGNCKPVGPFPAPVGSLTRHRGTGLWVAVYQAKAGMPDGTGGSYAVSGFYTASSPDLLRWSPPTLVLETPTLYDSPCGARVLRSYPTLIDSSAKTRNFEDMGDAALLTFAEKRVEGCRVTHERKLLARKVRISRLEAQ